MNRWFSLLMVVALLMVLTTGVALAQSTYQVRSGDTLWRIAEQVYGDGAKWMVIAEANGIDVAKPRVLRVGESLTIPVSQEEVNKALIRREVEEFWNTGNLDVIDEIYAADLVFHNPFAPHVREIEGYKQYAMAVFTGFPDFHLTIEDLVAGGDKVTKRWTARGTQTGEFLGIPPTGKQVTLTGIVIFRIAGGKIVEIWENYDALGMMQQLGVIPPLG